MTVGARKHLATQWRSRTYKSGSILRCRCGKWESNPDDPVHVQREAHRAHRVDMGEEVAPRRPTVRERLQQAEATIARLQDLAGVYEVNAATVDDARTRGFFEMVAEEIRGTLDPPPELLAEEEAAGD